MTRLLRWLTAMLVLATALVSLSGSVQAAERYKPFVLAQRGPGDFKAKIQEVRAALEDNGFQVVGDYEPYAGAHIIIFTSDTLKQVAAKTEYGGFAAPMRVSVTQVGDEIQVAYVNPVYMAYAYRLKSDLSDVAQTLEKALGRMQTFGSKRGLTKHKLHKYHYTFGMEYFDDVYELAKYRSHAAAVKAVEAHLRNNDVGVHELYRIDIPGKEETVIGVSMKAPSEDKKYMDDKFQMGIVNFKELKQTAYLPYEVMVTGNRVVALHMRFRMAVYFPDLRMMGSHSFMRLMPSPKAIRLALTAAVGGEVED